MEKGDVMRKGSGCQRALYGMLVLLLLAGCGGGGGTGAGGGSNNIPVANAGLDQEVTTGSSVVLDGSDSSDADADTLTYSWTLITRPAGSSAVLATSSAVNPTFTADLDGQYVARLVVNDGVVDSAADDVTITAASGNIAPVADAGPDQDVAQGASVTLDGSGSTDANSDTLSYSWTLDTVPSGSGATLTGADTASPTFIADVEGSYLATLVVNDGTEASAPDTVTVIASASATPLPPTYDFGALDQSYIDISQPCDTLSGTTIGGGNIINQTWTAAGSPYHIQGDITVPQGSSLSVQPGVIVCVASSDAMAAGVSATRVEITIDGTLSVWGSAQQPVVFRSVEAATTATPWQGLIVSGTASGTVDHLFVANAVNGIDNSGVAISDSVFMNNGTGVRLNQGVLQRSVFVGNITGIYAIGTTQLQNLLVYQNQRGVELYMPISAQINNSTIDSNVYGIYVSATTFSQAASVRNSIITRNLGYGVFFSNTVSGGYVDLYSSDVWSNTTTNANRINSSNVISANPLFAAAPYDYSLSTGSFCIDTGVDLTTSGVTTDIAGAPRPLDGDGISGAAFDMGAYEK